jgi:acetyltransferase
VLVVRRGGVAVEAVRDTAVALPPLNALLARDLMQRTRVFRLLAGYRDVPAADLDALAAILAVSRAWCACCPG